VPLLDSRLVEGVLQMPDAAKQNGRMPKSLLLDAVGADLPELIRQRSTKRGFTFPFELWLRGGRGQAIDSLLRDIHIVPWLNAPNAARVGAAFQKGRVHWSRPWALAVLSGFAHHDAGSSPL
jgi:hypothetical protein